MSEYRSASDGLAAGESRFEPFDLSVYLGPNDIPSLSAASRVGFVQGIPRSGGSLPPLPDLLDYVYDYIDAVTFAERRPEPELSQILGELVFGDPTVLQLFQATRGVAADRDRQLLFRILAAPHLAGLPWELLPDPATGQSGYLALAPDAHMVRVARGLNYPARAALLEAPLNLLIVLSSPTPRDASEEWLTFDIFEVKRGLLTELAPLEQAGMLNIDVEDRPTLENLRRRIGKHRKGYHLFHYVGHALPDRLILQNSAGYRSDLSSSQFMEVLRLCPDLRLAIFAGCETARAAADPTTIDTHTAVGSRDLISLSDCCVQKACPAVIGMQAVLPFGAERVFTAFFYQALVNGYSTAEALRLARGAIRGNERVGGDLLDWSVPTLFVGANEPGRLLPPLARAIAPAARVRWDLKLGLRQSSERFMARELVLRQAAETMTGQMPERVLVITGAPGVGKTSLIDRALEEAGKEITHVLYVHFDRLAPQVVDACFQLDADTIPDLEDLKQLVPDRAAERLCQLASELLGRAGTTTWARDSAWSVGEWWEHIVQDLVENRFVLVIEDVDLLDRAQRGLLERLIKHWLAERMDADLKGAPIERVLDDRASLLSNVQEVQALSCDSPSPPTEALTSFLAELGEYLAGLPDRLLCESRQVLSESLEDLVVALSQRVDAQTPKNAKGALTPSSAAFERADVITALNQLERVRKSLGKALQMLAERRSPVRIVITARNKPQHFLDLPDGQVCEMRLAPLTWTETWSWMRRNLPGLLSFGEFYLKRLWLLNLGADLDRWEALEQGVVRERGKQVDLQSLAERLAPRTWIPSISRGAPAARRGQRELRVAIAGPHLKSTNAFVEAITQLAEEHGIEGGAVLNANRAPVAAVLDEALFADGLPVDMSDIEGWLRRVFARMPDIVLLDYAGGSTLREIAKPSGLNSERALLHSGQYRALLIAAGGRNEGPGSRLIATPSAYPEVLSVGPLDDEGQLRPYAEWTANLCKPDLFMTDNLAGNPATTALAEALKPSVVLSLSEQGAWGSSFAALHAVATATLVWSILPELPPQSVRALLMEASKPIAGVKRARSLTLGDAVNLARRRAVERRLRDGPASLQTLGAMTGLGAQVLADTLRKMDNVIRLTSGRLERYQLR